MDKRMKLLPRYLKTFGIVSGWRVFIAAEIKQKEISLPGIAFAFHLRKGTSDLLVFREVFLFKTYQVELDKPSLIVDAGANIGLTAIYFSNRFPGARIIAVEPDAANFHALVGNVAPYKQIVPVQAAIWNKDVSVALKDEAGAGWSISVAEDAGGDSTKVPGLTITTLMRKFNLEQIDLLKVDIEGAEKEVFEHPGDWLAKTRCIILEIHDWMKPGSSQAVMRTMSQHNFFTRVVNSMLVFTNLDGK